MQRNYSKITQKSLKNTKKLKKTQALFAIKPTMKPKSSYFTPLGAILAN